VQIYSFLNRIIIMKIRLTPSLALISHFFILTNITAQVKGNPNYKFDFNNIDSSFLKPRIPQKFIYSLGEQIKQPLHYNNLIISLDTLQTAELIASNNNFDIYKLPLDNMPCLTPNKYFHGNMNTMNDLIDKGLGLELNDKIPNPFKKQDLIPLNNSTEK
jgi:hypothetical protein